MKKVAIILSGAGVLDGAEIHESVLTMLALSQNNASYQCVAPDIKQVQVINHSTGKKTGRVSRNILSESARIARGRILPLHQMNADEFDAIIFPGGAGVTTSFCDFDMKGKDFSVNPDIEMFVKDAYGNGIPLGFICIAPLMAAKIFTGKGVLLTIGDDLELAELIDYLGCEHVDCEPDRCVMDEAQKIISTPGYMNAKNITQVFQGISELMKELLLLI